MGATIRMSGYEPGQRAAGRNDKVVSIAARKRTLQLVIASAKQTATALVSLMLFDDRARTQFCFSSPPLAPFVNAIDKQNLKGKAMFTEDTPANMLALGTGKTEAGRLWVSMPAMNGQGAAMCLPQPGISSPKTAAARPLIETASFNGVNPQTWHADTIVRIPDYKITRVNDLLPWETQ